MGVIIIGKSAPNNFINIKTTNIKHILLKGFIFYHVMLAKLKHVTFN